MSSLTVIILDYLDSLIGTLTPTLWLSSWLNLRPALSQDLSGDLGSWWSLDIVTGPALPCCHAGSQRPVPFSVLSPNSFHQLSISAVVFFSHFVGCSSTLSCFLICCYNLLTSSFLVPGMKLIKVLPAVFYLNLNSFFTITRALVPDIHDTGAHVACIYFFRVSTSDHISKIDLCQRYQLTNASWM